MLLRKPYAFLIKHFRIIHIILSAMMIYLVIRTNSIRMFLNEYIINQTSTVGLSLTDNYINTLMYIFPFLIIVLSIIIIALMHQKNKPIIFYIINIGLSLIVVIMYSISFSVLTDMQGQLVDLRVSKALRDFIVILLLAQAVITVLNVIRAIGFDVKKFNFTEDLMALEITDVDNEEFEFDIKIDSDKIRRKANKRKRYIGYIYKENKLVIQIIIAVLSIITCFIVILNVFVFHKTYTQNVSFSTDEFIMNINNVYITNKDYRGNTLKKDSLFVILDLNVRTRGTKKLFLNTGKMELQIGDNVYYHDYVYKDKLIDLGNTYYNNEISRDSNNYLIVYEIPKSLKNKKMMFKYINNISSKIGSLSVKSIDVNLNARDLDKVKKEQNYNIGDTIDFKGSVLKNSTFSISEMFIENGYKLNYKVCLKECYDLVEYVRPSVYNSYEKTLFKLNSSLVLDETLNSNVKNINNLFSTYSEINYTINNEEKIDKTIIKEVIPNKAKEDNINYFEVLREVKDSDKIIIKFKVRDYVYNYVVK